MNRSIRGSCFVIGAGLIAWIALDYFLLAFLTSRFLEGPSAILWVLGFFRVLFTSPVGLGGILFLTVGMLLKKAGK